MPVPAPGGLGIDVLDFDAATPEDQDQVALSAPMTPAARAK